MHPSLTKSFSKTLASGKDARTSAESPWAIGGLTVIFALLAALMLTAAASVGRGAEIVNRGPIGPHTPLFTIEKNENPQNVLVVFTKLDLSHCQFQKQNKLPIFSNYWLMDGERYKPVHPLIERGIQKRIELVPTASTAKSEYRVRLNDFKEVAHDLGSDPELVVRTSPPSGAGHSACDVQSVIQLGPSDLGRSVALEKIEVESKRKMLPPFRQLQAITLVGSDLATGEKISRTYRTR